MSISSFSGLLRQFLQWVNGSMDVVYEVECESGSNASHASSSEDCG